MTALEKLRAAKVLLEKSGIDNANGEAELIISYCLGIDRVILYKDNPRITESEDSTIDQLLGRRKKREPLQYILGYTEFHGLKITTGPGVLIPRPETELLVEEALKALRSRNLEGKNGSLCSWSMLDLCTGSGCIALALGKNFPGAQIFGTDTSEVALGYAKKNAEINGIKNVTFLKGNLFEPVETFLSDRRPPIFDLIISNPPYIESGDIENLQPEIKDWEPAAALDGGEDGLNYYRAIITEARNYLTVNGILFFELGIHQAAAVKHMAEDAGFHDISVRKDYAGLERIFIARA